jgi:multidrug transporter EmrE-like cation transporter
MYLLSAISAALFFVVGGVFMQKCEGFSQGFPTVMIYICFGLGATLQTVTMMNGGMGVTYILVVGLEAVFAVTCGAMLFNEGYSPIKLLGIALIAVGIIFSRIES